MNLGRQQLGRTISLYCLTTNGSVAPTVPDDAPVATIQNEALAVIESQRVPVEDKAGQTGLFKLELFLGALYAVGWYTVTVRWATGTGTYFGAMEANFEIIAGGHAEGPVEAMTFYRRPHVDFIVHSTSVDRFTPGRNPRV